MSNEEDVQHVLIEQIYELLDQFAKKWYMDLGDLRYGLEQLDPSTEDYNYVCKLFMSRCRDPDRFEITAIARNENPILKRQYWLKREKMAQMLGRDLKEMELFHGTPQKNINRICRNNFDPDLWKRSLYGQGVAFAEHPAFATFYAPDGVLILARVLVGKSHKGCPFTSAPNSGYDTTTNRTDDPYAFIKYKTNEFYPRYVIHFKDHGPNQE